MPNVVVADASCLIVLDEISRLDLLTALYHEILLTPEVAEEFGNPLPEGFHIQRPKQTIFPQLLSVKLDRGEASAIALCLEHTGSLLIIDEKRGRNVAQQLGISITGTLGICLAAKEAGLISEIKPLIKAVAATDFFMSEQLIHKVLRLAGE